MFICSHVHTFILYIIISLFVNGPTLYYQSFVFILKYCFESYLLIFVLKASLFRITNNAISLGAAEDALIEKRELIIEIENEFKSLIDLHLKTPIPQDVFNKKLSEVNDRL